MKTTWKYCFMIAFNKLSKYIFVHFSFILWNCLTKLGSQNSTILGMRQLACACSQKCSFGLDSIMWQEDLKIGQNYPLKIESVSLVFTCLNNWQIVIETKYIVQKLHFNTFLWLLIVFKSDWMLHRMLGINKNDAFKSSCSK